MYFSNLLFPQGHAQAPASTLTPGHVAAQVEGLLGPAPPAAAAAEILADRQQSAPSRQPLPGASPAQPAQPDQLAAPGSSLDSATSLDSAFNTQDGGIQHRRQRRQSAQCTRKAAAHHEFWQRAAIRQWRPGAFQGHHPRPGNRKHRSRGVQRLSGALLLPGNWLCSGARSHTMSLSFKRGVLGFYP